MFAGFRSRWIILLVCGFERVGDLASNWQGLVQRDRAACYAVGEVFALDEFHHEGLDAIGVLEPVNGCDVRVIQRGKDFRLALKPREPLGVGRKGFGQDFSATSRFRDVSRAR